ncbi:MAG TPA: vWA domain-containing protein [Planctomycetaceae bacterium]|nr:vWA domain-containing protein [Planctomycetaceae bacterium]
MNQTLVESAPAEAAIAAKELAANSPPGRPQAEQKGASGTPALPELRGKTPSWVISLIGHLLILVALWPIHFATMLFREPEVTASVVDEETISTLPQEFRFDAAAAPEIGNGGDNSSESGLRMAPLGTALETPKAPVVNVAGSVSSLGMKQVTVGRPLADVGVSTTNRELSDLIETTGSTEHTGGVKGAIDRLTVEIEASLRQENTLVVWLFDATPSMKSRRDQIADRFDNVYRQLGLLGVGGNGALKTAVATFGKSVQFLTKRPVDDIAAIKKAIRKIEDDGDEKGAVENVFSACLSTGERFRSFRIGTKERRRVMIVVVTDERGSDTDRLETAIVKLRKLGMRVYCVGDDAVFGRERHYFPYVFSDGFHGLAYTNRGPETADLEGVQLPFWGGRGRLQELTSGFGPYALCRLCAETGGLYLISEELAGPRFDAAILRNYAPDYRPKRDYEIERARNVAKAALYQAAVVGPPEKMPQPQLVFRADNDNTLRQQITEAQKPLAELDYRLNEMHTLLEGGERDRSRLDTPRWKASFDLAMGRVLAMRARALGYNLMLAEMKLSPRPFQDASNNTWRIEPASEDKSPSRIQRFAKRAREYLQGVIEDHRGTQWEALAREELESPMGWDWHEIHVNYPPPRPPRPPRIQLDEERERNMPRQPPVSHEPPKL